ncbi:MAG: hypothetical protein JXQ71_08110 [Verrucomicrobia bacterium]|nr:hypothetical protein [Verrucomicrobiota bacterium]
MSACFAFGLAAGKPIEDLTYCSDLVHSAAKAGKPITGPAMVDSNNATNLVKALAVRGFFKGGSGEAPASAPTFNDVIDSLEAPVSLALRMDALQAAPGGAGGAEAADRQAQLAQLKAELEAAARVLPAKLAALKTVNNTLAVRLRRYQENIQDLRGKGAEWAVIAAMKDLPRKEVAVATLRSGLDFLALHRKHQLWTGLPVLIVVLLGGFTTNFLWCVMLNLKNRTGYQYFASRLRPEHAGLAGAGETHGPGGTDVIPAARDLRIPRLNNLLFSALAGTTWYFQFFFYTMGATQMGKYDFASWTLHMASIIIFSTMWGWILREWKGSSKKAHGLIAAGIATLILSTIIIGFGTWLKGQGGGQ